MNTAAKLSIAAVSIVASIAAFVTFAPPHIKDKAEGVLMPFSDERQCFSSHQKELVDPYSAYLVGSRVIHKGDKDNVMYGDIFTRTILGKYDSAVFITIKAKNSLGGYVEGHFECPLVRGSFDERAALNWAVDKRLRGY